MVPLQSRGGRLSSITHSFPWLSSPRGYVTYVVLPRSPLSPLRVLARLACLIHAANVHSEPGSNPFSIVSKDTRSIVLPQPHKHLFSTGLPADTRYKQSRQQPPPFQATTISRLPGQSLFQPFDRETIGPRMFSNRSITAKLILRTIQPNCQRSTRRDWLPRAAGGHNSGRHPDVNDHAQVIF